MKTKLSNIHTGLAGQHYVCYEFARRGYHVGHLLGNSKDIDILVSNESTGKQYRIQVKTTKNKNPKWAMTKKVEFLSHDNLFYVLVQLSEDEKTKCFVVPSKELSQIVTKSHQDWLNTPNKKGGQHKDNDMRLFIDSEGVYLDKWEYFE